MSSKKKTLWEKKFVFNPDSFQALNVIEIAFISETRE